MSRISPQACVSDLAKIGKNTRIRELCSVPEYVEIGDNCFIAAGTNFYNCPHPWCSWKELRKECIKRFAPKVLNNVVIGGNCSIMPGVVIGKGQIVGTGTTLSRKGEVDGIVLSLYKPKCWVNGKKAYEKGIKI